MCRRFKSGSDHSKTSLRRGFVILCLFHYIRFVKEEKADPNFFDLVYQVVRLIPEGRVTSYGAIAKYLGAARSARMVGWAMNGSHVYDEALPAHRVVNRNGLLSGRHHFANGESMQDRLEKEGIRVVNDQIQDFKKVFWDPGEGLTYE